jgi:transposase
VGQARLAAGKKNATRLKAYLVFLDEAGFFMAPLVRRSWRPRGQTPILYQRTRHHQKVSAIAALCVAPARRNVQLYFRLHPDNNINAAHVVAFLQQLLRQLHPAPIILIWDRLNAHRAKIVKNFVRDTPSIRPIFLPPYAPELNPVEYAWGYLKNNPLANYACSDIATLADTARRSGRSLQRKPSLLRAFVLHSPLSLRLR